METEQSNVRAQVEQVFGLTGGELMDEAWEATYQYEHPYMRYTPSNGGYVTETHREQRPFTFTYWYEGTPAYVEAGDLSGLGESTYRTVIRDDMFGAPPETVTDDEGTWVRVLRYSSSGETQCPYWGTPLGDGYQRSDRCMYCEALPGEEHGYVYIGDGWYESVYRLEGCPWTSAEECAMASERSVAGVSDTIPGCAYHGRI